MFTLRELVAGRTCFRLRNSNTSNLVVLGGAFIGSAPGNPNLFLVEIMGTKIVCIILTRNAKKYLTIWPLFIYAIFSKKK